MGQVPDIGRSRSQDTAPQIGAYSVLGIDARCTEYKVSGVALPDDSGKKKKKMKVTRKGKRSASALGSSIFLSSISIRLRKR